MRIPIALALWMLTPMATPLPESPEPFRVLATPSGCAVSFGKVPDEYRIDSLVSGGVQLTLYGQSASPEEKDLPEGCVRSYRISPAANGTGAMIEIRPRDVEFGGLVRSGGNLQLVFERVVHLGAGGEPARQGAMRDYRVGPGDVLKITVFGHEDLSKPANVGSDGRINYSLLGAVNVAGKTPLEIQEELAKALGRDYIVNPQVSVEVDKFASQYIYVNGPVNTPGRFPLQGGMTLKDAISLGGGLSKEAGYSITVARKAMGPDGLEHQPETMHFSRADLESGRANEDLQPGDVVTVSEKDYFYIQMEVRKPGKYDLTPGMTILQAISLAEGTTDWANRRHVSMIRNVGGHTTTTIVDLKNIERQKAPDIPLAPNDIIIVPRRTL